VMLAAAAFADIASGSGAAVVDDPPLAHAANVPNKPLITTQPTTPLTVMVISSRSSRTAGAEQRSEPCRVPQLREVGIARQNAHVVAGCHGALQQPDRLAMPPIQGGDDGGGVE